MRQEKFSFDYSEAILIQPSHLRPIYRNLIINVNCIAHIHSSGASHHIDINYIIHDGGQFGPEFLYLVNPEMLERVEQAAEHHSQGLFQAENSSLETGND